LRKGGGAAVDLDQAKIYLIMASTNIKSKDTPQLLQSSDAYFEVNGINIGRGEAMFLKAIYLMS
jgi:hypothetical protein